MNPATTLFLLVGLPGAGKTTRAREVAERHPALRSMAEALGVASEVLYLPVDAATQRQRVALRYRDTPGAHVRR